jgi:hypothetical protein
LIRLAHTTPLALTATNAKLDFTETPNKEAKTIANRVLALCQKTSKKKMTFFAKSKNDNNQDFFHCYNVYQLRRTLNVLISNVTL